MRKDKKKIVDFLLYLSVVVSFCLTFPLISPLKIIHSNIGSGIGGMIFGALLAVSFTRITARMVK